MAPAQSLVVDDGEGKLIGIVKSEVEEVNGSCKELRDGLVCKNNCEDSGFYGDSLGAREKVDDGFEPEINVTECVSDAIEPLKTEDLDATEHSSSFGNTFSGGSDDGGKLSSSDMEVDSQFSAENCEQPVSAGYSRIFKKKKVTAHWRRFISPIMWRCQWLELQMHELQSQALLYDKELAGYKREKQLQSKMIELDDSVSRSVPLICQSHKKRAMKRRKRRRNEDTVDIASYMSNHNIFSYYENKRSETDGHSIDDDCSNQDEIMRGIDDHEWLALGFNSSDNSLEQVLLNIETLQSRVLNLKTRLNKVTCITSEGISPASGNCFQGDPPTSYAQSHSYSAVINGDAMPSHHISECELEEMAVPGSAVSSYGDAADLDISMGLFSGADGSLDLHNVDDFCKDIDDDVLINNHAADEELQNFEIRRGRGKGQELPDECAESCSEDESTAPNVSTSEPGPERENVGVPQEPALKPCYAGKRRGRKPKRKRRGGSATVWRSERLQKRRLN